MSATRAVSLAVATAIMLTACENSGLQGASDGDAELADSASIVTPVAQSVTRDVERPDIFSASENALWDGRPSLGGIWVAHPDVVDPERVKITNTSNGQTVSGALFRRERNNPGPRIQVSSDAADALGILAGQPTELSLVVVRTEEVEIAPPPMLEDVVEEDSVDQLEETEAPQDPTSDATIGIVATDAAVAAAMSDSALQEKQPGFWQRFRNSLRNEPIDPEAIIVPVETADTAEDASVPNVEIGQLDPIVAATAAIEAAEDNTPSTESSLKNPYVQVGLFKLAANANSAAASLRQAGIVPEVKEGSNNSGPYWRVIIGPMNTAEDQAALLSQVKGLGYRDAFLTTN